CSSDLRTRRLGHRVPLGVRERAGRAHLARPEAALGESAVASSPDYSRRLAAAPSRPIGIGLCVGEHSTRLDRVAGARPEGQNARSWRYSSRFRADRCAAPPVPSVRIPPQLWAGYGAATGATSSEARTARKTPARGKALGSETTKRRTLCTTLAA